jgi:DNA-binding response OmpR family regulator
MAKRILITDDEQDIVKVVKYRLIKKGFEVIVAVNGQEGVDTARAVMPDLILLDYRMPILNGDEVCRELKKDESTKHIPIILMTASIENILIDNIRTMGADDYILKPFEPEDLMEKIERLLA